jgi:hypothetical protein
MVIEIPEVDGNRKIYEYKDDWENKISYCIIQDVLFRQEKECIQVGDEIEEGPVMRIEKTDSFNVDEERRAELLREFLQGNRENVKIIEDVRDRAVLADETNSYELYIEEEWSRIYNHLDNPDIDKDIRNIKDKNELLELAL